MSKAVTTPEDLAAVARGMRSAEHGPSELALDELACVHGGMKWEHFTPSPNVEDRRGQPRGQYQRPIQLPPPKLGPRYDGDLPSQLGLDDLIRMGQRRRR